MLDPSVTKRSWRRWACFSTAQSCLQTMSQSGSRLRKTRRFCKVHAFMEKIGDALCYERDRPSIAPFEGNTADEMLFFLGSSMALWSSRSSLLQIFTALSGMLRFFCTTKTL